MLQKVFQKTISPEPSNERQTICIEKGEDYVEN